MDKHFLSFCIHRARLDIPIQQGNCLNSTHFLAIEVLRYLLGTCTLQSGKIPKDEPDTAGVFRTDDQVLWADDQKFPDDTRSHRAALA